MGIYTRIDRDPSVGRFAVGRCRNCRVDIAAVEDGYEAVCGCGQSRVYIDDQGGRSWIGKTYIPRSGDTTSRIVSLAQAMARDLRVDELSADDQSILAELVEGTKRATVTRASVFDLLFGDKSSFQSRNVGGNGAARALHVRTRGEFGRAGE